MHKPTHFIVYQVFLRTRLSNYCAYAHIAMDATLINPRCMREGYGSRSVCLSVITLAATYLVCESNLLCCNVPYGVPTHDLCGFL